MSTCPTSFTHPNDILKEVPLPSSWGIDREVHFPLTLSLLPRDRGSVSQWYSSGEAKGHLWRLELQEESSGGKGILTCWEVKLDSLGSQAIPEPWVWWGMVYIAILLLS